MVMSFVEISPMRDGIRPVPVELNVHGDLLRDTIKASTEYCCLAVFKCSS